MDREILEGEHIIDAWNGITLTTRRVLYAWVAGGNEGAQTLSLSKVQHASLARRHQAWLLYLSGLALLFAVFLLFTVDDRTGPAVFAASALIGLLIYFATRSLELRIGAGMGLIRVRVRGGKAGARAALSFLKQVDAAMVGELR